MELLKYRILQRDHIMANYDPQNSEEQHYIRRNTDQVNAKQLIFYMEN